MRIAYDFHIHTSLSPCADNDMTPNNIVHMSVLKGLDAIAITDHNSCANAKAVMDCARELPLLVIPGMEIETSEEIHVVCLFPDMNSADTMQQFVYSRLPGIKNKEDIFGEQILMNQNDEPTGKEDRLLLVSSGISINEVFDIVEGRLNGIAIPAHIDRSANSILASFGVMPGDIDIHCVEISKKDNVDSVLSKDSGIARMKKIFSSDAHHLGKINERENFLEADALGAASIIRTLRKAEK